MAWVNVVCPVCGGALQVEDDRDRCFCQYCGTLIEQERIRADVKVTGVANEASLLERGFMLLEDGETERANDYFERVLDISPKRSRAYIGQLLCYLGGRRIEDLKRSKELLGAYDQFQKAKSFANEQELSEYIELERHVFEKLKVRKQEELDEMLEKLNEGRVAKQKLEKEEVKLSHKNNIWLGIFVGVLVLLVVSFAAYIVTREMVFAYIITLPLGGLFTICLCLRGSYKHKLRAVSESLWEHSANEKQYKFAVDSFNEWVDKNTVK